MNLSLWIARDYVRRVGRDYVLAIAALAVLWLFFAVGGVSWSLALALTLAAAAALGPTIVFGSMARRELLLMPVSRRELWRARWLLSTLIPLTVVLVAQALGVLAAMPLLGYLPPVLPDPALTAVCVLLYTGAMMGLAPAQAWWSSPRRRLFSRIVNGLIAPMAMVAFLGGMLWPILLRSRLPETWSDVRGWMAVVFVVGAVMTVLGYRRVPGAVPHNLPRAVQADLVLPGFGRSRPSVPWLTGVNRLLWLQLSGVLKFSVPMFVLIAGATTAVSLFVGSPDGDPFVVMMAGVAWFAGDASAVGRFYLLAFIVLQFMDTGMLSLPRSDSLRALLRHLRTLPFTAQQVVSILLVRRILGLVAVWLVVLGVFAAVSGTPKTLGLPWLAALIGLDAVLHGWSLIRRWSYWETFILAIATSTVLSLLLRDVPFPNGLFLAAAAFFLLLAFAVLRSAITNRRETYQPVDLPALPRKPFGFR